MTRFLNTSSTTFVLESLINKARKRVILISPYLKINKRVKELIEEAIHHDVRFQIVYGKQELKKSEKDWLLSNEKVDLYYCDNLHAKCYLNESHCIIGSMNLYEFSQVNNNEMSLLINKKDDAEAFTDAVHEAERLIRISEKQNAPTLKIVSSPVVEELPQAEPVKAVVESKPKYSKITTSKLAAKHKTTTKKLVAAFKEAGLIHEHNGIDKLTDKGVEVGAEFKKGPQGYYFIWPEEIDLNVF